MEDAPVNLIQQTFDTVAAGYDSPALRFFVHSAAHLVDRLGLRGNEHVLDVACGTGNVSLALARRLPQGRVTAVDFSTAMLAHARAKAAVEGLGHVDWVEGDMQALPWRRHFDVAVCAFGIFFVEDMVSQLRQIAGTVKPGGRVIITNFARDYMQPMRSLLVERVRRAGVEPPPQTWLRIADVDGCKQLFADAGLTNAEVEQHDVGYALASADEWWQIVWNAGFRRLVSRVPTTEQEGLKTDHLAEVDALRTPAGIPMPVPVLFTSAVIGD
jgi:ubiquinone/menaquinone biosynthesis C-methylase UbiE